MAIGVLPVNRLILDDMLTVLPLLCKATMGHDPARWEAYSRVVILNRNTLMGWRSDRWRDTCADTRSGAFRSYLKSVISKWETELLWKLASPADTIGYGEHAVP